MLEIVAETVGETDAVAQQKVQSCSCEVVDTRVADTSDACSTAVGIDDIERESRGTPLRPGI